MTLSVVSASRAGKSVVSAGRPLELTRELTDLDEAEQLTRTALAQEQGDPTCLASLSGILYLRLESTGQMSALDEAIAAPRQAIGSTQLAAPTEGNT